MKVQIRPRGASSVRLKFVPGIQGPQGAKGDTGDPAAPGSITNLQVSGSAAINATKLAFAGPKSGEVARTVDAFLQQMAVPERFGANVGAGDPYLPGGNDDGDAIQKCLDALGACVLTPNKVYWIARQINMPQSSVIDCLGGTAEIRWTTAPEKLGSGWVMIDMKGNTQLRSVMVRGYGAWRNVQVTTGNSQRILNSDIREAYGSCLAFDPPEKLTNPSFVTSLSGWTARGTAAWNSGGGGSITLPANDDAVTQAVTTLAGQTTMVVIQQATNVWGAVTVDVGTTPFGQELNSTLKLFGPDWAGVSGQHMWTFSPSGATTYVTIRKVGSGSTLVAEASVKEAGVGTGFLWDTGIGMQRSFQTGTYGELPAITLPLIEPTTVGLRKFISLNGAGTPLFATNGGNYTWIVNCFQLGDLNLLKGSTVKIQGGRIAGNVNFYGDNSEIHATAVAGALSLMAGATNNVLDCDSSDPTQIGLGSSNNLIVDAPGRATIIDNSGGANVIIGGKTMTAVRANLGWAEGTFTPGLTFGGNNVGMAFSTRFGSYTKIGGWAFGTIRLTLSAKGTSMGVATVTGLPFTTASGVSVVCPMYLTGGAGLTGQHLQPIVLAGGTTILLRYLNAATTASMTDANFTNTTDIILTFMYATTA